MSLGERREDEGIGGGKLRGWGKDSGGMGEGAIGVEGGGGLRIFGFMENKPFCCVD